MAGFSGTGGCVVADWHWPYLAGVTLGWLSGILLGYLWGSYHRTVHNWRSERVYRANLDVLRSACSEIAGMLRAKKRVTRDDVADVLVEHGILVPDEKDDWRLAWSRRG